MYGKIFAPRIVVLFRNSMTALFRGTILSYIDEDKLTALIIIIQCTAEVVQCFTKILQK